MEDLESLVKEILEKGYVMSLGTSFGKGTVWVADVVYVHDDNFNLYWFSHIKTRHSEAIAANKRVAATITLSKDHNDKDVGLQIGGWARKLDGELLEIATKYNHKKRKQGPHKLAPGQSWYELHPTKIMVIYEPLFGLEAKKFM